MICIFLITENTAIYQVKRADRNEYLKIKVLPTDYDGLLFFGLVHNHPDLYTRTIINKMSSLSVENGKLLVYNIINNVILLMTISHSLCHLLQYSKY